jgi:hypothetical protein
MINYVILEYRESLVHCFAVQLFVASHMSRSRALEWGGGDKFTAQVQVSFTQFPALQNAR